MSYSNFPNDERLSNQLNMHQNARELQQQNNIHSRMPPWQNNIRAQVPSSQQKNILGKMPPQQNNISGRMPLHLNDIHARIPQQQNNIPFQNPSSGNYFQISADQRPPLSNLVNQDHKNFASLKVTDRFMVPPPPHPSMFTPHNDEKVRNDKQFTGNLPYQDKVMIPQRFDNSFLNSSHRHSFNKQRPSTLPIRAPFNSNSTAQFQMNRMLSPNVPLPVPDSFLSANASRPISNSRLPTGPIQTRMSIMNQVPTQIYQMQERGVINSAVVPHIAIALPSLSQQHKPVVDDLKAEYRQTMIGIVKQWIQSRNSFTPEKRRDNELMKIQDYRENLSSFVSLIDKLRSLNDLLAENMESDKDSWKKLMEDVTKTKNEVINLQFKLFNPEQMKFITMEQKKRKKKRDRVRRRKKVINENYMSSLSKRIQLNEKIDEALQKERTKIVMEKRDESLKNTAGESLVEVKRKQAEVSQLIDVFNFLKKLRELRKKTAIYQGIDEKWRCRS